MSDETPVIYTPPQPHRCRIVPDIRNRSVVLPTGPALAPTGSVVASIPGPVQDAPGTVRACPCGRTWVAHPRPPAAGWASGQVEWHREGRLARWWRERRQRRDRGAEDVEESARWEAAKRSSS